MLPLPEDLPFASTASRLARCARQIAERGWRRVAGFQTRNPIHRAHEHLTKLALEFADGLVHPSARGRDEERRRAGRASASRPTRRWSSSYYPHERTLLAAFPAAMRYAGPREALFHALVRKNYGITRLIVGRDHAGVGKFYGPYEAQQIFDRFTAEELGVTPLKFEPTFFCRACDALASPRTCPHDAGLAARALRARRCARSCAAAAACRAKFTRPEIAEILRDALLGRRGAGPTPKPARRRLHRLVHGPLGRGQEHARRRRCAAARPDGGRSRSSTATRSARTCRRASASPRRTATRTSAASASWRGCWRATASAVDHARPSRPTPRSATRCAGRPRQDGHPLRRGLRARPRSRPWPRAT